MQKNLKAFQIKAGRRILDYRLGNKLDLDQIRTFFETIYKVKKIWSGGRHILGILEKNNRELFLKLSTSEGISAVTENEYRWNEQFNKLVPRQTSNFWVPENKECGFYENKFFYFISDKLEGELFAESPEKIKISEVLIKNLPSIIEFSEVIQKLNITNLSIPENDDHATYFINKTVAWYEGIPEDIREKNKLSELLKIINKEVSKLKKKPRHGDFTPWHLIKLLNGKIGLIDGEHARLTGVEYYDIGYLIQRVFSVLENPDFAKEILTMLIGNNYNLEKLRIILAARAIGGFLDESLKPAPNYKIHDQFKNWAISIT